MYGALIAVTGSSRAAVAKLASVIFAGDVIFLSPLIFDIGTVSR
jgi:hypothetical protein